MYFRPRHAFLRAPHRRWLHVGQVLLTLVVCSYSTSAWGVDRIYTLIPYALEDPRFGFSGTLRTDGSVGVVRPVFKDWSIDVNTPSQVDGVSSETLTAANSQIEYGALSASLNATEASLALTQSAGGAYITILGMGDDATTITWMAPSSVVGSSRQGAVFIGDPGESPEAVSGYYGHTLSFTIASGGFAVPEPGALRLFAPALVVIAAARRGNVRLRSRSRQIVAAAACALVGTTARADIYQWEYVDPADPSQGKRQSTTLAPDGAGVDAAPGARLGEHRNLTKAYLFGADLMNSDGVLTTLTDADLSHAKLTNARFGGTSLVGADLSHADLVNVRFGPTRCSSGDLSACTTSGASFAGASLRNANARGASFRGATLTDADVTGANVQGADFSKWSSILLYGTGISLSQLYATASYQAHDLSGVQFGRNELADANFVSQNLADGSFFLANLANADFSHANLTNTDFNSAALTGANFAAADSRGAWYLDVPSDVFSSNLIRPNGHLHGLELSSGGRLVIHDYDGNPTTYTGNPVAPIPIPITVDNYAALASGGALRMVFEADAWDSTISFVPGIPVALGGALELTFADEVNLADQVGRTLQLFDWTGVAPTGAFAVASPYRWDLSNLYSTGEIILTAVPEPASLALLVIGALSMLTCRRACGSKPSTATCAKKLDHRVIAANSKGVAVNAQWEERMRLVVAYAITLAAILFAAGAAPVRADLLMTGAYVPEFQAVDVLLQNFMAGKPIPGGTITITLNDKVIYERGIGYSNAAKTAPMQETALMRLASLSKPVTASAIHQLAKDGQLNLHDRVFNIDGNGGLLDVAPYNGVLGDHRLRDMTVQHLLEHRGGWNRDTAGDLAFRDIQIASALGVPSPPGILNTAKYILSRPLQFTPGADFNYSNVGYMFLGMVVEAVSGQPYETYVDEMVLGPAGIPAWEIDAGRTFAADQNPREPVYSSPSSTTQNVYDPTGPRVTWPYGGWDHERFIALGGLIASSKAMAMLAQDRIIGGPEIGALRSDYTTQPEYWWYHGGSLEGTDTLVMGGMGVWGADWKDATYSILFDRRPTTATSYSNDLALLLEPILEGIAAWPAPLSYAGDFTNDQWLTFDDITLFKQALTLGSEPAFAEAHPLARYAAGDFDGDGVVSGSDAAGLIGALQHAGVPAQYVAQVFEFPGDFDLDRDVDGTDFLIWQRHPDIGNLADWMGNFGPAPIGPMNIAVPEPASVALLATAILARLLCPTRRRTQFQTASPCARRFSRSTP